MKDEVAFKPAPPASSITPPSSSFSFFPAQPPPVRVSLLVTEEHVCPYLPGRMSRNRAFWAERMPGGVYHRFMDAAFRRSGKVFYQPVCRGCRACQPIRVPVATFRPSKSQRRCRRRNQDLVVTAGDPHATDEKFELYLRYACAWHGKDKTHEDREGFESFLYESPVDTVEYTYRDASGRLLAVGICDLCPESLSSVYFYFDPADAHRGLGTFGAVYELEQAARAGVPYYYLGYWVEGCGAMQYKNTFRPCEVLHPDGVWRPMSLPASPQH
jgi:arginine-tRNA-protein transferase